MLLTGIVVQVREGQSGVASVPRRRFFTFSRSASRATPDCSSTRRVGLRRRFASFATQTYLSIACYHYGELTGDASARSLATACVQKLIALQGPQGEWPWFFDAASGRVLDFYEVYSVHQYGMAPALLECAERHNVPGAREALVKGFKWVLGENQLGRSMLVPELGLQHSLADPQE